MYKLTWHEIFSLSDATDLLMDTNDGVTDDALRKFEEFNQKVRANSG